MQIILIQREPHHRMTYDIDLLTHIPKIPITANQL